MQGTGRLARPVDTLHNDYAIQAHDPTAARKASATDRCLLYITTEGIFDAEMTAGFAAPF